MDLAEWKIKIENFPVNKECWDRDRYSLLESRDGKYAFFFYGYTEYAMGWEASDVAILTDKNDPKVIFDSKGFKFRQTFKHDFVFAETSCIAILVRHCYHQGKNISGDTFCLLDFINNKFSILSFEVCDFYCLKEIDAGVLQVVLAHPDALERYEKRENKTAKKYTGINILLSEMIWMDLIQIENYNDIYCDSPQLFNITNGYAL